MSGMTHTPRRSRLLHLLIGLCVLVASLTGVATAQADEAGRCTARVIEQPFGAWDDWADYFLAPGGDFADGGVGWDLAGAEVVAENEPWHVHGDDVAAVRLESGASATSPAICVGVNDPTMRFFAHSIGDVTGTLSVEVLHTDVDGTPQALTIGIVTADSAATWTPVTPVPITANDRDMTVAFRFTAQGANSTWLVDDVYIDPYRKG